MGDGAAAAQPIREAIIAALPRLRRFCQSMAGNPADGDDLMQSTVERALARSDQFREGTRVDSWMFRITQNLHIDAARSSRRRGTSVPVEDFHHLAGEDGRVITESRNELAAVQRALATVPADQRAAFLMVVVEGLTYREAAEALDVPVGTIMSRIARARAKIETSLTPAEGQFQ